MTGLTRLAGIWSRDPDFLAWLGTHVGKPVNATDAAAWIRQVCGVASRRELDTDASAGQRFLDRVRGPYLASQEF